MKLRDIGFTFGFSDWAVDGKTHHQSLSQKSWAILVYIQKRLAKSKLETDGISGIWFAPVQERELLPVTQRGSSLNIDVRMDWDHFEKLSTNEEVNALICDLYEQGLDRIEPERNLPVDFVRDTIRDFREGNYENKWTFKTKNFRAKNVKAQLDCTLDIESFQLLLTVWQGGEEVFHDIILQTYPDPFYYYYAFKDLQLKDDVIVVPRRKPALTKAEPDDKPLFQWVLKAKC